MLKHVLCYTDGYQLNSMLPRTMCGITNVFGCVCFYYAQVYICSLCVCARKRHHFSSLHHTHTHTRCDAVGPSLSRCVYVCLCAAKLFAQLPSARARTQNVDGTASFSRHDMCVVRTRVRLAETREECAVRCGSLNLKHIFQCWRTAQRETTARDQRPRRRHDREHSKSHR